MNGLKIIYSVLFLFSLSLNLQAENQFKQHFRDGGIRFEFSLAGNSDTTFVVPELVKKTPFWSGSKKGTISPFNYGTFRYLLLNNEGVLIFSRGFSPLFWEWQTTVEAKKVMKAYKQAVFFPIPKNKVTLIIERRNFSGTFDRLFSTTIDPDDYHIWNEKATDVDVVQIRKSGKHAKRVDLAIMAEGYTQYEMDKFIKDAERMTSYLFNTSPFDEFEDRFNVYAVQSISQESGTDIPGDKVYKNTVFNSHFYTFDSPRYLTTSNMSAIYDAAENVPWDYLIVLVNHKRYGGGGFYNFLSVCSADDELSEFVYIHEFGHAFAGLADEYYTSSTAYDEFYNLKIEPWEPNITTMIDFESKWKDFISDTIPIPTPRKDPYLLSTGAFEGGGYLAKGIFSPAHDCVMKSSSAPGFCEACKEAIRQMIRFYTE